MGKRKTIIVLQGIASHVADNIERCLADGWECHGEIFCKHYTHMPDTYTQFMSKWIDDESKAQEGEPPVTPRT